MSKKYLQTYFKEKELPIKEWTIISDQREPNYIDSDVVIEYLLGANTEVQRITTKNIRIIDFHNGDVYDFLKFIAEGLVNGKL
jgi:hypothetical protein